MAFAVRFAVFLLRTSRLNVAERNALSTAILDRLEALPLRGIIEASDEGVLINGRPVNIDKLRVLREAAVAAIDNQAFNYIAEQVRYIASERLLQKVNAPEDLYFYRAAIWFTEQMKAHLQILAQRGQELPL